MALLDAVFPAESNGDFFFFSKVIQKLYGNFICKIFTGYKMYPDVHTPKQLFYSPPPWTHNVHTASEFCQCPWTRPHTSLSITGTRSQCGPV